jgi:hypothetical protein
MLGTVGTYAMGFSHGSDKSKKLQYTALRTPSNSTNETNCPRLKEHPQFKNETNANNPFGTNGMFRSHTNRAKFKWKWIKKKYSGYARVQTTEIWRCFSMAQLTQASL